MCCKDSFLPKDIRETIIGHIARFDSIDTGEKDMVNALINGLPGLNNMSDRELIEALLECCPLD